MLCAEKHSGTLAAPGVGKCVDIQLRLAAAPFLVLERLTVEANRFVKPLRKRLGEGREVSSRTLARDQPMSIHDEFIATRLSTEDRVVFQHQAAFAARGLF